MSEWEFSRVMGLVQGLLLSLANRHCAGSNPVDLKWYGGYLLLCVCLSVAFAAILSCKLGQSPSVLRCDSCTAFPLHWSYFMKTSAGLKLLWMQNVTKRHSRGTGLWLVSSRLVVLETGLGLHFTFHSFTLSHSLGGLCFCFFQSQLRLSQHDDDRW